MHFPPFGHKNGSLDIWGDQWAVEGIQRQFPGWPRPEWLHTMQAYEAVTFADGTRVLPLRAAHFTERSAFNFVVERGGKTLLYGQDSGWFPEDSWQAQQAFTFDVVVLDCTHGPIPGGALHGGTDTVIATKQRMLADGTATESTIFVANHFSHNGGMLHDELVGALDPHGILVSYDGMVIEV